MIWKQGGCLLLLLRCDCLLALHQGGRQQNKRKEEEEGKNTLMAYWMDSLKAEANHPAKLLALLAEEGLSESRTPKITSPLLSPSFSYFSSTFSSKFIRAHPPESNRIESEHKHKQLSRKVQNGHSLILSQKSTPLLNLLSLPHSSSLKSKSKLSNLCSNR